MNKLRYQSNSNDRAIIKLTTNDNTNKSCSDSNNMIAKKKWWKKTMIKNKNHLLINSSTILSKSVGPPNTEIITGFVIVTRLVANSILLQGESTKLVIAFFDLTLFSAPSVSCFRYLEYKQQYCINSANSSKIVWISDGKIVDFVEVPPIPVIPMTEIPDPVPVPVVFIIAIVFLICRNFIYLFKTNPDSCSHFACNFLIKWISPNELSIPWITMGRCLREWGKIEK